MKQVIAMHGWCSDSTYWQNWESKFILDGWYWKNAERGYGCLKASEPFWIKSLNRNIMNKRVFICHSLGLHLISTKLLNEASHVILLNSFSRFIPDDKESRSIKTALNGMYKHIGKTTEKNMLLKFYSKANKPYKDSLIIKGPLQKGISFQGRKKLKKDLEVLINSNKIPTGLNKKAKLLIVNGTKDQIISSSTRQLLIKDLGEYLETSPSHWEIKGGGHFLNSSDLINRINHWLKTN